MNCSLGPIQQVLLDFSKLLGTFRNGTFSFVWGFWNSSTLGEGHDYCIARGDGILLCLGKSNTNLHDQNYDPSAQTQG
jgi:hypothetical protein